MRRLSIILAAASLAGSTAAQPPAAEEGAIIASVRAFVAASNAGDGEALRALIEPGGVATGVGCGPEGRYDSIYTQTLSAYIERILSWRGTGERLIDHEVRTDRNLATVWGRYEYGSGERVMNRGYSSYQLIRVGGRWKIFNFSWSTQPEECPGGAS